MSQTIVALATPPGRSGIGVIRLSGETSLEIVRKLIRDSNFNPPLRTSLLRKIYDSENSDVIDQALLTYFKAPHSFTGEDVIEISCHGSPVLLRQIVDSCLKYEARLAQAGEFSLRALSNNRLNLSQAEAIRDLINAQTVASARQAVRQLGGELSNQLQPLKDELLDTIVILESALEFVEDDLPDLQIAGIKTRLRTIISKLEKLAATFKAGRLLREGLRVSFAGRPNVGKSSLFNALVGHDRAIVTDIAGTTRDSLSENISIRGIPVSLVDTAGLRETFDQVESLGVDRTKRVMADSDLIAVVLDSSQNLTAEDEKILEEVSGLNYIIVMNKIDLGRSAAEQESFRFDSPVVKVSAKNGEGLEELQQEILKPFSPDDFSISSFLISDARHFDLLNRAGQEVGSSLELLEDGMSEEIVLLGLHNALRFLGEITGETTTEDMLGRIFSTFCIGK